MKRAIISAAFILCVVCNAICQNDTTLTGKSVKEIDGQILEQLAENSEGEPDYTDIIQKLSDYKENPININAATPFDLRELGLLTEFQIRYLTDYVKIYGRILTINELMAIEGFDKETIQTLSPYIYTGPLPEKFNFNLAKMLKYSRHDIILRYQQVIEPQRGYNKISDSAWNNDPGCHYLGGKEKLYFRYRMNVSKYLSAGFLAEKDAGETFLNPDLPDTISAMANGKLRKGFDHFSTFINVNDIAFVESLIVGDYHLQFGQGLTLWSNMSMGKSFSVTDVIRHGRGILPVSSSDENRYFRGIAIQTRLPANIRLSSFYSSKKYDARMVSIPDSLEQDEFSFASSLQETGLHRTISELEDKDKLEITVMGSNISFQNQRFKIGLTGMHTQFSKDLIKDEQLYNQYSFKGHENINLGVDFSFLLKRFLFFAESSGSKNNGKAAMAGIIVKPAGTISFSVLYRNYGREYQNFFANAFAENSTSSNEEGMYAGINMNPSSKISLSAYIDHFRFPWLKYRINCPSTGSEYSTRLNYCVSSKVNFLLSYRFKAKQINVSDGNPYHYVIGNSTKQNVRFQIEWMPDTKWEFTNRLEYVLNTKQYSNFEQDGYLIYQDIAWKPNEKLSFHLRYALFNTDSYDERIYSYENDVLYGFSIPGYYYGGTRYYALIKYSISSNIDAWLRYSVTCYYNQDVIGSQLEEINGNKKSEIKLQLRFHF